MVSKKIFSSTTIFNIDNKKYFLSTKSEWMICEGSCDTEDLTSGVHVFVCSHGWILMYTIHICVLAWHLISHPCWEWYSCLTFFFLLFWTSQVCRLQFPHSQEQEGFYRSPTPVVCLAYTTACGVTDKPVALPTSLHHTLISFPLHLYSISASFSIWSIYEMLHFSLFLFSNAKTI